MAGERRSGVVTPFLRAFLGSIGLIFFPMPIGIFRRQLSGYSGVNQTLEFYSHPNIVCAMHLIWIGWLVTLGELYNDYAREHNHALIPSYILGWVWLAALVFTLLVMGMEFGRVAVGFLIAGSTIILLGLWLLENRYEVEIFESIRQKLKQVKVGIEWGVPLVVSTIVGVSFAAIAAWRRLNDRWILPPTGNYLEHENFQEKDRTISKELKTFTAVFPCLIRRYLYFGFGSIEFRSSTGEGGVIDVINGVFFARHYAEIIKSRFSTTDMRTTSISTQLAKEAEEERNPRM